MKPSSKILITGAAGMVGSALVRRLKSDGFKSVTALTREDCDLEDRKKTLAVFERIKPQYVFHLAAKVGGIKANMEDPVGFLHANVLISTHVLEACHEVQAEKTLVLGSSCVYPRLAPQPMREDMLMDGPLEPTNEGYALAKIVSLKLAQSYSRQYGMKTVCPMPSNIYGPGDTFDLERSHVLSALVRRFVEARNQKKDSVTLWGTGSARREFIHVDDVVRAMIFFMERVETSDILNVGSGEDVSIKELALKIAELTGYQGKILWDASKPDGMPRKCMDVSKLAKLGYKSLVPLDQGIEQVIRAYENDGDHK